MCICKIYLYTCTLNAAHPASQNSIVLCIYIHLYIYTYIHMHIRIHICTYMYPKCGASDVPCIFTYINVYIYIYISVYIHMYSYAHTCTYIHICTFMYPKCGASDEPKLQCARKFECDDLCAMSAWTNTSEGVYCSVAGCVAVCVAV